MIVNYDLNIFIVQATVAMIVNYVCKMFIAQATCKQTKHITELGDMHSFIHRVCQTLIVQ
jgi:hypothetical protein